MTYEQLMSMTYEQWLFSIFIAFVIVYVFHIFSKNDDDAGPPNPRDKK